MDVQTCAYEPSNAYNSDYGKINITSVIMCFLIIYSTALSIVLSVKQLIQIIKEEELLNEEEEEEVIKEEEEEVIKEEEEEEEVEEEEEEEEEVIKEEELQLKYRKQIQLLFEEKIKNTARGPWPTNIFWDMLSCQKKYIYLGKI
jgi:flagellar biosynthesis component FlhA